MRESNYTFPPSNRAVISINQMLYDRRALDTNSTLALLNNLCQLTYLTSTSPRIREVLTMDGGLERMLDILRDSCLPREPTMPDLWGLNKPCTARTLNLDRAISLRHSLAFQCVVNIGVRGNEAIRTRVVQAGALDIVAQILESWLKKNGIAVFSNSLGSQASVDAVAAGIPLAGVARHRRQGASRHQNHHHSSREATTAAAASGAPATNAADGNAAATATAQPQEDPSHHPLQQQQQRAPVQPPHTATHIPTAPAVPQQHPIVTRVPNTSHRGATAAEGAEGHPQSTTVAPQPRGLGHLVSALLVGERDDSPPLAGEDGAHHHHHHHHHHHAPVDTDVDMADAETEGGETDANDTDTADPSMDVEYIGELPGPSGQAATTPRARLPMLPLQIPRRSPDETSQQASASSAAGSPSGDEPTTTIPRTHSDLSLALTNTNAAIASGRPRSGLAARVPQLVPVPDPASTQSSPMGTPVHVHAAEHHAGERPRGRRGTVVGRPLLLQPRDTRRTDESETSDGAPDTDLAQATLTAGIAAAAANAAMEAATAVANQPENGPQPAIVDGMAGGLQSEDPDPEVLAAEQARFDMEAGAPPGQPGAAQTPRVATTDVPLAPANAGADLAVQVPAVQPTQIIIANSAPRGFQDLGTYVGISLLMNPEGTNYSEDNILLALQLLAYLSKYPHVRATFHHPRRPMHRTFELGADDSDVPLPQRPAYSETPNIFSLVERFTFRPSPSDPLMFRIPSEIQYWAGVIMRNACRKDDSQGGIRQCAYMSCGRWEVEPREFAKCRRCRKAKYCSKDCQSKAWSEGHRFWCSIRSEPDPSVDGTVQASNGAAGGGGYRREFRRDGGGGGGGNGGGGNGGNGNGGGGGAGGDDEDVDMDSVATTPRARQTRAHATLPDEPFTLVVTAPAAAPAETTPRGAAMPTALPRASPRVRAVQVTQEQPTPAMSPSPAASPIVAPPLPPTTAPPPAPTLSSAPPPTARRTATESSAHARDGGLPDFLKNGPGTAGPSSTARMNAAMGR